MGKNLLVIRKLWNSIIKKENNVIEFPKQYRRCEFCNSIAKWKHTYMPNQYSCDECVPKDCGCTLYKKSKHFIFSVNNYNYTKNKTCEDWEKFEQ